MKRIIASIVIILIGGVLTAGEATESGQREIASKLHSIQGSINANTKAINDLNETLKQILDAISKDKETKPGDKQR